MATALAQLERTLFTAKGERRLPTQRELDLALARVTREQLFHFCETRPRGPLYLLPTREFVRDLAAWLLKHAGRRGTVLEVGAGDGFLTRTLLEAQPRLRLKATDSGDWEQAAARMTPRERRRDGGKVAGLQLGANVVRQEALAAIRGRKPDVVLAAWLPPGKLFEQIVRAPCRLLVEIGTDGGVTAQGEWGWRFAHDFAPELEPFARSRLDAHGDRRTQVACYFGKRHSEFMEERPKRGDWLWRFRPGKSPSPKIS